MTIFLFPQKIEEIAHPVQLSAESSHINGHHQDHCNAHESAGQTALIVEQESYKTHAHRQAGGSHNGAAKESE